MADITNANVNDITATDLGGGTTIPSSGFAWYENARLLVDLDATDQTQFTNTTDIAAGNEGAGRTFYAHGANLVLYDLRQQTANTDIEFVDCTITIENGQSSLGASTSPLGAEVSGVEWTLTDTFLFATRAGETGFGAVASSGNEVTLNADGLVMEAHEGAVWFVNMAGLHENSSLNNVTFIRSVINSPSAAFPFVGFNLDGTIRSSGNPYIIRLTGNPGTRTWSGLWNSRITGEFTLPDGTDASTSGATFQDFWPTAGSRNYYSVNNVYARSIAKLGRTSPASSTTILEGYTWRPMFEDSSTDAGITDVKIEDFSTTAREWFDHDGALDLTSEPTTVTLTDGDYFFPADGEQSFFFQTGSLAASTGRNTLPDADHAFEYHDDANPDARTLRNTETYNYFSYTHAGGTITTEYNEFSYSGGVSGDVTWDTSHNVHRDADELIANTTQHNTATLTTTTGTTIENTAAQTPQDEYKQLKEYNYRNKVQTTDVPATHVNTTLTYSRPLTHGRTDSTITFTTSGAITSAIGTTYNGNATVDTIAATTNDITLASGVTYGGSAETNFETTSGDIIANGTLSSNCTLISSSGTINVSSATLSSCTLNGEIEGLGTTVGTSAGTATIEGGSTINLGSLAAGTYDFATTWGNLTRGGATNVEIISDNAVTLSRVPDGFVARSGGNVTLSALVTFSAPASGTMNVWQVDGTTFTHRGTLTSASPSLSRDVTSTEDSWIAVYGGPGLNTQVYRTGTLTATTTISAPTASPDALSNDDTAGDNVYTGGSAVIQGTPTAGNGNTTIRIDGTDRGTDGTNPIPNGIQTNNLLSTLLDDQNYQLAIAVNNNSLTVGSWSTGITNIVTFVADNTTEISELAELESDGNTVERLTGLTGDYSVSGGTATLSGNSLTIDLVDVRENTTPDSNVIGNVVADRITGDIDNAVTAAEAARDAAQATESTLDLNTF